MPTQEERLSTLERSVASLRNDITDINHNETLLLGLAMKQAEHMRELKISVAEFRESVNNRFDAQDKRLEEQGNELKGLRDMLSQVLARLPEKP